MTAVAEEIGEVVVADVSEVVAAGVAEAAKPKVKAGKPKAQAKVKKPSWRQRKKELEAARAAAGAAPVKQVVKTAKPRKPRTVKAKIKKRAGDRRRGPLPAEVSGLVAKKKELQAQIDGLDSAIKAAVLALRAAKGKA